jgi:hypothetical protein
MCRQFRSDWCEVSNHLAAHEAELSSDVRRNVCWIGMQQATLKLAPHPASSSRACRIAYEYFNWERVIDHVDAVILAVRVGWTPDAWSVMWGPFIPARGIIHVPRLWWVESGENLRRAENCRQPTSGRCAIQQWSG